MRIPPLINITAVAERGRSIQEGVMADIAAPELKSGTASQPGKLVEMNWDPITRIVGSLGIYTKIDFEQRKVAECYSTSSIFAATASS